MADQKTCPVCQSPDYFLPGETVDIGFGKHLGAKVAPDTCEQCGYVEQGLDPADMPIQHYIQCWNEQRSPSRAVPMIKRKLSSEYEEWISQNVRDGGYGQCREVSAAMVRAFPHELRRVHGVYQCPVWGDRSHFWCLTTENVIVDPTAAQFPTAGAFEYVMRCDYPLEYDDKQDCHVIEHYGKD